MTSTLTVPGLDIVRTWHTPVRAVDPEPSADGLGLMEVRFSVFDTWYRVDSWWEGSFMERTAKGAFAKTIRESGDQIKNLFQHGADFVVGDRILGTQRSLTEEDDSPVGVVDLFDTSYNRDLLPGLRAGVYGSSFMFQVVKDEWNNEPEASQENPDRLPERTIREVRLYEYGPVTWPANPAATAGMRCLSGTDAYYENLRARDPHRVEALRSRITALRATTPAALPEGGALAPAGAAPHDHDEPATGHSAGMTPAQRRARLYPYLEGAQR